MKQNNNVEYFWLQVVLGLVIEFPLYVSACISIARSGQNKSFSLSYVSYRLWFFSFTLHLSLFKHSLFRFVYTLYSIILMFNKRVLNIDRHVLKIILVHGRAQKTKFNDVSSRIYKS